MQYFQERGRTIHEETWHFVRGLDNPLDIMLYYLTIISL